MIMPTGGGKSLCYQIPALAMDGLTIVISPLIALMDDQVAALKLLDIPAGALHTNTPGDEARAVHNGIEDGSVKLLYVSPERAMTSDFFRLLGRTNISLFAIDEAHCVSVWGNDFRPEYVRLSALKQQFPDVPTIALTATADAATRKDIINQLHLRDAQTFISSFERHNIKTAAKAGVKRIDQIYHFLAERPNQAGIVYCLSRKSTEKVAERLVRRGYNARAYHAGMDSEERSSVQQAFQDDSLQIVCATIAFGMGIDKPNIRWVIHYNMPKNIESYYQEIGRAGRDGEPAETLLFYSWSDRLNLQKFIDESEANPTFKEVQSAKLERMWQFATALSCRTNLVLSYFGEYKPGGCDHCDNCLEPREMFDGTKYAQMALSAIVRTREAVGLNLLIDILRGSNRAEVVQGQYHRIVTYGVGRAVPFADWRHYITQMINQGIIAIDFTDYSRLKLTPLSKDVLKGDSTILLGKYVAPSRKTKPVVPKLEIAVDGADPGLIQRLKSWRTARSKKQGVPPYVILHDKSLKQIAALRPVSKAQLMSIDGIGEAKCEKYGEELIGIVASGN